jgi:hypothetical protein
VATDGGLAPLRGGHVHASGGGAVPVCTTRFRCSAPHPGSQRNVAGGSWGRVSSTSKQPVGVPCKINRRDGRTEGDQTTRATHRRPVETRQYSDGCTACTSVCNCARADDRSSDRRANGKHQRCSGSVTIFFCLCAKKKKEIVS